MLSLECSTSQAPKGCCACHGNFQTVKGDQTFVRAIQQTDIHLFVIVVKTLSNDRYITPRSSEKTSL